MSGMAIALTGLESSSSTTDSQGGFEFSQLPRGTYQLSLSGFDPAVHSFPTTQQTAKVKNGNLVEVLFSGTLVPYPPDQPMDLTAQATGSSTIMLSWTDVSDDETRFEVHRKEGVDGPWDQIGAPDPNTVGFEDLGLTPTTTFGYRVRACNEAGCSDFSSEVEATTDDVPPGAPMDLTATTTGPFSVFLTWTDESENETGFEVERKEGTSGSWEPAVTAAADATEFGDMSLSPNTSYVYRIRACNDVGCSTYSDEADTTTDEVAPEAPLGLIAGATGSATVALDWSDGSDNELNFEVERKPGTGGEWAKVGVPTPNATSFSDTGLTPHTTYQYRVRACSDVGCSAYSNQASVTTWDLPPEVPTGLTAVATGPATVDLGWTDMADNEDGFRVERREGAGSFSTVGTVGENAAAFSDSGLSPNTTYSYRVFAFNPSGDSPSSNTADATTPPDGGPNLNIANLYLTQSTQTLAGDVPLVADKDGYLRVFAVASEANSFQPSVRVRFYLGGSLALTEVISAPAASVPTSIQESSLGASWNVGVPASLIQPGLSILADVDPTDQVTEGDESDNFFPVGGSPLALDVRITSAFPVTFVPVRQSVNGLVGNVTMGNAAQFLDVTLRMLPIAQADVEVHAEYVTDAPALESGNDNGAWGTILSEVNAVRVGEASGRYYYGVVSTTYNSGVAGMGYLGWPTAIGWDKMPSGSAVAAHEWGHNWNRYHAPGCGAGNPDGSYPYSDGKIGVWGLDVGAEALKSPATHYDFMSYCNPDWISDYSYEAIMDYRQAFGGYASQGAPEPSLLVWGRVEGRRIIPEPAFEVNAAPNLPTQTGSYLLEGYWLTGEALFSMAFQPIPVPDAAEGDGHFAFTLPLRSIDRTDLSRLRVSGGGHTPGSMEPRVGPQMVATPEPEFTSRGGSVVEMRWDGTRFPMALVRNPATGEILSFARDGHANLVTSAGEVEVIFSDGLRNTERIRRRIR